MTEYPPGVDPGRERISAGAAARREASGSSNRRSQRGLWGAIVLLLALPLAVMTQVVIGSGSETIVHFALAAGAALVAFSTSDFETPRWIAWIGGVSAGGLAAIFLLQGVSQLVGSDSLSTFAYQVLGNWPERLLLTLFVLWLVAMLLTASRGRTRILGFVTVAIVVCLEAYGYFGLLFLGTNTLAETPGLRALYLLPLVWLAFESGERRSGEVS